MCKDKDRIEELHQEIADQKAMIEHYKSEMVEEYIEKPKREKRKLGSLGELAHVSAEMGILSMEEYLQELEAELKTLEIECPHCQAKVSPKDNYCTNCGFELIQQDIQCSCGHLNKDRSVFCSNCGEKLQRNDGHSHDRNVR